jgi:hypothetical protein
MHDMITIYYTIDNTEFSDYLTLECLADPVQLDREYIAELCAESFYNNHDGWECKWPVFITLWADAETNLGTHMVEMEAVPHFYAWAREDG